MQINRIYDMLLKNKKAKRIIMIHSFIITGFLGVGKSSMLTNTIKNHFPDQNIALIVNEFGEIGVDQNILKNVHSDVIEISEGCICCQMAEEFETGLIEITNKYKPDILFIETSGEAEPFPVFLSVQNLGISIEGAICVIDAKNYESYMHNATAKYQVGGSNIIVLNKTDLVTEEELKKAEADIIEYKEKYDLKNTFTGKKVFNNYVIHHAQNGIVPKDVFEGVYPIDEIMGLVKNGDDHEHSHDAIDRRVGKLNPEIVFDDVEAIIKALPKNIYRVKGMVKVTDVPTPLIVNYAFGNSSFEELKDYDEESALVFIGEDIDKDLESLSKEMPYLNLQAKEQREMHTHTHEHHHHD